MKVVINSCFGGYSISEAAVLRLAELKGKQIWIQDGEFGFKTYWTVPPDQWIVFPEGNGWSKLPQEKRQEMNRMATERQIDTRHEPRNDPDLVRVVEEMGDSANGSCAELEVVEIPDDIQWEIEEYDGNEHVAEKHRTWR